MIKRRTPRRRFIDICEKHGETTFVAKCSGDDTQRCLECDIQRKKSFRRRKIEKYKNLPKKIISKCAVHGEVSFRRAPENLKYFCTQCRNEKDKARKKENKENVVSALGGKCVICGYNKTNFALEFHHLDPTIKENKKSTAMTELSQKRIKEELEKCVLLCANCHREVHAGLHPEYLIEE